MPATGRSLALRERLGLAAILAGLALLLAQGGWLWRWDQLIYDAQLRFWSRPAPDDIVIIAIDQASLEAFGRWPWDRELHARLLQRLTAEQPRAVAFDVIFAEPDLRHPAADRQLEQAVAANGRVVLPVLMEQDRNGGQPVETLPLAGLAESAAGLGHVHVELDPDGMARRLYLREGLGGAYWPHISLAMLELGGQKRPAPAAAPVSPMLWVRQTPMLIPYAGPPGHFHQVSYLQVIQGNYAPDTFRDKYVLIGTTAAGLGDALPTPMSGYSHAMSGVELNANVLAALRSGIRITPIPHGGYLALTALLAILPMLVYPRLAPRSSLPAAGLLLLSVFLFGSAWLWLGQRWFPPTAALVAVAISYPLWSWRRLEQAMRFLNQELDELTRQRAALAIGREGPLRPALSFLGELLPIDGWVLRDADGRTLDSEGCSPALPEEALSAQYWLHTHDGLWKCIEDGDRHRQLGVRWAGIEPPGRHEWMLLDALGKHAREATPALSTRHGVLQARIAQVQEATRELQQLRGFVDNSLANMADGVLVCDPLGQVLLSNARAAWYLLGDDHAELIGHPLPQLLEELIIRDGGSWSALLKVAILEHSRAQATVRHRNGRDLLVQISPLTVDTGCMEGLILNFSDISPLKASERKRDELLHFLSHDLRSPLVSLMALFELANRKTSVGEIRNELVRMKGYTEKTLNLAEQFLQLARAESGVELPFYEVDLVNLVWNACEQVWAQAQAREISIQQHIEPDEAWVLGDGNLLERALVNLLTNAIKFSAVGQVVEVNLQSAGEYYRCCVRDEGRGIPAEELPRLFDRFQRVHRQYSSEESGAGLGLAFVDAVISRHGGQVEVQSSEHTGSRFCLILHRAADT